MFETIELGSAPYGEDCAQVGRDDYYEKARKECAAYKRQLMRIIGDRSLPENFSIRVKGHSHDFGTYYEVECRFNIADEDSWDLAAYLESNTPERWDSIALQELSS